jgi:hypothetical protein
VKNGASGRDPALRGILKMLTTYSVAALSGTPCAWDDGPRLVFHRSEHGG